MANQEDAVDDELESKELMCYLQQDSELTRLSEMVRKHYLNYLEKQLQENLKNSDLNKSNGGHKENYEEIYGDSIKKTAELLEDKAVKACMIGQLYQRAMIKIISIVRRSTQEKRIITQLEKLILSEDESKQKTSNKETQTEAGFATPIEHYDIHKTTPTINELEENDKQTMTLDEKIQMFQKHLQKEKCAEIVKKCPSNRLDDDYKLSKRNKKDKQRKSHHRPYREHHKMKKEENFSPAASIITPHTSPHYATNSHAPAHALVQQSSALVLNEVVESKEDNDDNDSVALELARLFSEEKTELDEIFGIDPNEEPDDPQICKILKEIEEATINYEYNEKPLDDINNKISMEVIEETNLESLKHTLAPNIKQQQNVIISAFKCTDLSKSIWPCELFMQRRKLSDSLARLIEEDLRWHDVMKWKFTELFGEDSDDEFTPCSPSIELDDILMGSCIKRISPWVVKHLMKPMKDGLISNRFLFKKLAKHLARCIIMENQYPDEFVIKNCIENFFCLHQVVMSLDDLIDIPSISLL